MQNLTKIQNLALKFYEIIKFMEGKGMENNLGEWT